MKRKSLNASLIWLGSTLFLFSACQDKVEVSTSADNTRVHYTVTVIDGSNATGSAGVSDVVVTIAADGEISSQTVNSAGQVVFPNLRKGFATVSVESDTHTDLSFLVELDADNATPPKYSSTIVPIYALDDDGEEDTRATLIGSLDYVTDLASGAIAPVPAINITATLTEPFPFQTAPQYADNVEYVYAEYSASVFSTTTDGGEFELKLPADGLGEELVYTLSFESFIASQLDFLGVSQQILFSRPETDVLLRSKKVERRQWRY